MRTRDPRVRGPITMCLGAVGACLRRGIVIGLVALCTVAALPAFAQDVRSLGMGGVLVPGPGAAERNPAYAAVPGRGGNSIPIPFGVIATLVGTDWDPASTSFDALTLIDRLSHLDRFVLNPATDPDDIAFRVDESGLSIDVTGGSPLRLAQPSRFGSSFGVPIGASLGPVRLAVRPYVLASGTFAPGPGLARALAGGAESVSARVTADAEAGVAVDVMGSLPLPFPPEVLGGGAAYAGGRVSAKLGLARAAFDGHVMVEATKDGAGAYTGSTHTTYDATLAEGGVLGDGLGYGVDGDLGFVVVTPSETGTLTLGFAVENLGVMIWNVNRTGYSGDGTDLTTTDLGSRRLVDVSRALRVGGNLALELDPDQIGVAGMGLLLAADAGYALDAGANAHFGVEATFGPIAARAGVGLEDGVQLGLGAGIRTGGVAFDVALSSHRSPFTLHQAYGLSAGVSFGF